MADAAFLSDGDVGIAPPKFMSDADVGLKPQAADAGPQALPGGFSGTPSGAAPTQPSSALSALLARPAGAPPSAVPAFLSAVGAPSADRVTPAVEDIASRVGAAAMSGYQNMGNVLTPEAQDWVARVSENKPRPNLEDALTVGHALLAGGNAVWQGGLEGISALGDAVGQPELGRDVAGYLEAGGMTGAPHMGGILRPTLPETRAALTERSLAPPPPPVEPTLNAGNENVAGGGRPMVPLSSLVNAIVNAPTVDDAISQAAAAVQKPSIGGGGTIAEQAGRLDDAARAEGYEGGEDKLAQQSSVGAAATPPAVITQAPSEISAAQAAIERRMLNEPRIPGFDDTQYVPDEKPLLHEIAGDPAVSLEAKQLMQDPKYAGGFADALRNNNLARTKFLNGTIGDAVDVERMTAARDAAGDADRAAIWSTAKPVDAQPVVDSVDNILSGPGGKVGPIKDLLQRVNSGLYDYDGNLETDPQMLYGVRKDINLMLSKEAKIENPTNQAAATELIGVRDVIDKVITTGAPGWPDYVKNFTEASKPIDAMEVLQDKFRNVTTGADRNITFPQFDNALKQIIKMRELPGANDAKSIPNAVMDALFSLDNSLGRSTNIDLGKARGSDTNQLSGMSATQKAAISSGAQLGAHALALMTTGGLGNLAIHFGGAFVKDLQAARLAKSRDALVAQHLDPGVALKPPIVGGYAPGLPAMSHTPLAANSAFYQ